MEHIRNLYEKAVSGKEACQELIGILTKYDKANDQLLLGYQASATMLMAKHGFLPISKLRYFNKGRLMLEKAIAADPGNTELRLLRFLAQTNVPFFLNYDDSILKDKTFILASLSKIKNSNLKKFIVSSMIGSGNLSEQEENILAKSI